MKKFETPNDFSTVLYVEDTLIEYQNLIEINQGGPLIGNLLINKIPIFEDKKFGGPVILFNKKLVIPIFEKMFFNTSFKIAIIDINSLTIRLINKKYKLIYLKEVIDNYIFFYCDINKKRIKNIYYNFH